jgi:hypothetical protein
MTVEPNTTGGSQEYVDRLVGLANAERRERSERVPPREWLTRERAARLGLFIAFPILMAILGINLGRPLLQSFFEVKPPPAVARAEAEKALGALIIDIEAFRLDYKELPESLVEIGVPSRGDWTYAVSSREHYQVQGSLYGQSVSFDSASAGGR